MRASIFFCCFVILAGSNLTPAASRDADYRGAVKKADARQERMDWRKRKNDAKRQANVLEADLKASGIKYWHPAAGPRSFLPENIVHYSELLELNRNDLPKPVSPWTDPRVLKSILKPTTGMGPTSVETGCSAECVATASGPVTGVLLSASDNVKAVQPVLFATNRKIDDQPALQISSISSARSERTTLGRALVSIPKNHLIGMVERPKFIWYKLRMEDENDADHFRLEKLNGLAQDEFLASIKDSPYSAMIFVHGYNVSFDDAIYKTAQIAFDANYGGTAIAFSWPSRGKFLSYDYDRESAEYSARALFEVIQFVKKEASVDRLYIVAHSLGSRVVVDALQRAALSGVSLGITELVFAAPDVDKDVFAEKATSFKSVAANITLYASSVDRALLASKAKAGYISRIGYVPSSGPILIPGIETIDVTAVGSDMLALNHGTFSGSRSVLDDIGRIIVSGIHPPHVRTPTLQMMPNKTSPKYWMYPR